jgi:hypothetical protein
VLDLGACTQDAECCNNPCFDSVCRPYLWSCSPDGYACVSVEDCCSGACLSGICSGAEPCSDTGTCMAHGQCCSGTCGCDGMCVPSP